MISIIDSIIDKEIAKRPPHAIIQMSFFHSLSLLN